MKTIGPLVRGRETVVVDGSMSVQDAARLMSDHHIGAVPVRDGERLVGIFTERDVMARVVAQARPPETTTVADVMSTDLVVADVNESHDTCLRRLQQARVRHLIVLDRGTLAGILSLRDLLNVELDEKDEALTWLNAYVHYIPADLSTTKLKG